MPKAKLAHGKRCQLKKISGKNDLPKGKVQATRYLVAFPKNFDCARKRFTPVGPTEQGIMKSCKEGKIESPEVMLISFVSASSSRLDPR